MNWKRELQIRDLPPAQRLEATCRTCGHMTYLVAADLQREESAQFDWLDELERRLVCRRRGCRGAIRLARIFDGDTEAFIGGLA